MAYQPCRQLNHNYYGLRTPSILGGPWGQSPVDTTPSRLVGLPGRESQLQLQSLGRRMTVGPTGELLAAKKTGIATY